MARTTDAATAKLSKYAPTHAGLWLARADYDRLVKAADLLHAAGRDAVAGKVADDARAVGREVITIPIRCMMRCGRDVPCEFTVGDPQRAEPNTAMCANCSGKIDDDVARLNAERGQP